MGALLRVFGERNRPPREAGACYVFAAYARLFGGQMGLTLTAEASHVDVGAYVVIWHILPCCWLLAYVRLFLARAPADGYAAPSTRRRGAGHRSGRQPTARVDHAGGRSI